MTTKSERLRAITSSMTAAPWRWSYDDEVIIDEASQLVLWVDDPGRDEVAPSIQASAHDRAGIVALRNAAPQLLDLWEACEAERKAVCACDGDYGEDHLDACPVAIARAAVAAVLERGLP